MDRASTIRFYDHYGHVSAAVCYQNTLYLHRARATDGSTMLAPMSPGGGKGLIRKGLKASTKNFQLPSYQGNDHYQPLFFSETTSYGYYLFN